jgi:Arc/MetJ-type ribon-helix-helix transcriptional regulator
MSKDKIAVNISKELYELVKQRVKESNGEFKDVEEYIEFVLREIVKDEKEDKEQKYSKEDEEQIKQRLKSLGYL